MCRGLGHLHVERRRHQAALDLGIGRVTGLGGAQGRLDGINAVVAEAGDLDVGANLGRLGSELLANVRLELFSNGLAGELDVLPNIGIAVSRSADRFQI
jgi:hypothetical protein